MGLRRILIVVDNLGGGGAQRQIYLLAKNLKEPDLELSILTYHQYTADVYGKKLIEIGIRITQLDLPNYFIRFKCVRKYIKTNEPDIVLSVLGGANILSCLVKLSLLKKPKLYVSERTGITKPPSTRDWIKYSLYILAANKIVTNSKDIKLKIAQRVPRLDQKIILIWNMIEPPKLHLGKERKVQTNFKIVVGASYQRLKNVKNFIIGVGEFVKKENFNSNDIKIEWYGNKMLPTNSEYLNELEDLIKRYKLEKIFKLNGFTNSIQEKIVEADFAALPSFFEGCPNFIIEAMYLQKPILVSDVCSNKYIVSSDGGYFFAPNNVEDITKAVKNAFHTSFDERKRMGTTNKLRAEKLFSINEKLAQYKKIFND